MFDFYTTDDIEIIKELLDLNSADFAERIGVIPDTVTRWKNGKTEISADNTSKIYDYAFSEDIHLNKIKEQLFKEECKEPDRVVFFTVQRTV